MCDPTAALIMMGAGALINAGSAVLEHNEQQRAHDANRRAANEAAANSQNLINLRQMQEQIAAAQTIFQADLAARQADAWNRVQAGESGVQGISIDALISDAERQRLMFKQQTESNLRAMEGQLDYERLAIDAQRKARIASVPAPSVAATTLRILGAGIDGTTSIASAYEGADFSGVPQAKKQGLSFSSEADRVAKRRRIMADYAYYSERMRQKGLIK